MKYEFLSTRFEANVNLKGGNTMAICPFATMRPITGSCGQFDAGPFKIVHHTTEGGTAAGAMDAFRLHRSDPHFTVDAAQIFQHIDTGEAARALRNEAGGVETNRNCAIQIEVVGFAGRPKAAATLTQVARLCRWIELTHEVPRIWPSGPPRSAVNGTDPGGHNRDTHNWAMIGGHYGHCHVPENIHWDPAYSLVESAFILSAQFGDDGRLSNRNDPPVASLLNRAPEISLGENEIQIMTDHADVGDEP